jgi:rod shape-determining protein MreD
MIKTFLKIVLILFLVVCQVTLMPHLQIFGAWPNLVLVLVLVLTAAGLNENALLVAGLGGLFLDLASPFIFGFYTLIIIIFTLSARLLVKKFLAGFSPMMSSVIVAIGTLFYDLIFLLVSKQFSLVTLFFSIIYSVAVAQIFSYLINLNLRRTSDFSVVRLDWL